MKIALLLFLYSGWIIKDEKLWVHKNFGPKKSKNIWYSLFICNQLIFTVQYYLPEDTGWFLETDIATLGSILDSQLSWESGKFQLARWSHAVALLSDRIFFYLLLILREPTHPQLSFFFQCCAVSPTQLFPLSPRYVQCAVASSHNNL